MFKYIKDLYELFQLRLTWLNADQHYSLYNSNLYLIL